MRTIHLRRGAVRVHAAAFASLSILAGLAVSRWAQAEEAAQEPPPESPIVVQEQPIAGAPANTPVVRQRVVEKPAPKEWDALHKFVWLDAEGGIETANLSTFNADFNSFSVGFLPRTGTGPAAGIAGGVRFIFVTLGARARVASFNNDNPSQNVQGWNMASLDGELGFRIPLHRLEPNVTVAAGYTTFGGFRDAVNGVQNGIDVNGFNGRLGFGVDYFVSHYISLGGNLTGEVLVLTRPGVPVRDIAAIPQTNTVDQAATRFLEARGSSYGTAVALTGGLKAHF